MARKVAVVLGAGASYDCWNDTGSPARPEWRPPLARELFGARPAFWNVLQRYRGVTVLASELGELARGDAFNIELKLREYADHEDERIRGAFKEVPLYLRDVISTVVGSYTDASHAGSHIRLVMNLLATGANVAFIDLNYDPYIEAALIYFDPELVIRSISDYVDRRRQAILCKAHGSINWAVRIGEPRQDWNVAFRDFRRPKRKPDHIVLDQRRTASAGWVHANDATPLYPLLTAPLAGKGHLDLVCPDQHLDALREFLRDCDHYVVIGTSGQDEDLLAFLRDAAPRAEIAHYVSDTQSNVKLTAERIGAVCQADKVSLFFNGGFRRYLDDELFQDLLNSLRR